MSRKEMAMALLNGILVSLCIHNKTIRDAAITRRCKCGILRRKEGHDIERMG